MRVSIPSLLFAASHLLVLTSAIWPQPKSVTNGTQVLWLDPNVQLSIAQNGFSTNTYGSSPPGGDSSITPQAMVNAALQRFKNHTLAGNFVPWKFFPKGSNFEPSASGKKVLISSVTAQDISNPSVRPTTGPIDESYTLTVPTNGKVVVQASTANGILNGLNTLAQIFFTHSTGGQYTTLAPLTVKDAPFYSHRGLNLDVARNYQAPTDVMHTIDGMAFNKLNRLHIHATDSQSWPLEIPSIPELASKGAYQPNLVWSAADLKAIQSYAALQGIECHIEIDSPGHTGSIWYSHPELVTAFNEQPWDTFANEPPSGQLNLNDPAATAFFEKIYADLLPRVAPYSTYFHSGGDELNQAVYGIDPTVNSSDASVIKPFLQNFVSAMHNLIEKQNLTPIVWEEMLLVWNLTLNKNVVIQTWMGQASMESALQAGHQILFGDFNTWYLDCGYGEFIDPNGPNTQIHPPYADYCSPMKNWREIYSYDPTVNITSSLQKNILGGEVHMWGELTDPVNVDSKIWPRASSAAEVLWGGPKGPAGVNEDVTRRLAEIRERMAGHGFAASMVQMTWCLQNKGSCGL